MHADQQTLDTLCALRHAKQGRANFSPTPSWPKPAAVAAVRTRSCQQKTGRESNNKRREESEPR
eukprot:2787123-Alexandrium_andersonii.AAC.1